MIPRKNPLKNWIPPNNVRVIYGTKSTFNETVISESYIPLLVDYKDERQLRRLNFLFDQGPCHTTQRVRTNFVNASVDTKSVPKRMTSFLQPADVCWMKPLKAAYFNKWNQWLINAPRLFTAAGNRKSPGYAHSIILVSH